jgi:hypothetical protein
VKLSSLIANPTKYFLLEVSDLKSISSFCAHKCVKLPIPKQQITKKNNGFIQKKYDFLRIKFAYFKAFNSKLATIVAI